MPKPFDFSKTISLPEIVEVNRLVETFSINYHRAPRDMRVNIVEYDNNWFFGFCNYGIWGPDQADPYKSSNPKKTVIDALNDALDGIRTFDSATIPNRLIFWVSDDDIIYDGNREKITRMEAEHRRSNNKEKFKRMEWTQLLINGGPWWLISKNLTAKQFSVIGPIDNDTEYVYKTSEIQKKGIDFHVETVPINEQSKEEIIDYFKHKFQLEQIENDKLYDL